MPASDVLHAVIAAVVAAEGVTVWRLTRRARRDHEEIRRRLEAVESEVAEHRAVTEPHHLF